MLFVATPCYRSDPAKALAWATDLGKALGVPVLACCPRSPPWLHVGRAMLAGAFLDTLAPAMLFRDDDIDVSAPTVARMLAADVPAIVAPYVLRSDDGDEPPRFDTVVRADGSVEWAGLGCALVRRTVIHKLWTGLASELGFARRGRLYVAIFRDILADLDAGPELLPEDHAFWWRVQAAGFPVAALEECMVRHCGDALRWHLGERVGL